MVIQHNMLAAYASMQTNKNAGALSKSTQRLSSGYKVNSAADNAAALSISEGMRSQIRGLNKASNNIQDGMSYVQVADGVLGEIQDMLQRINELSVQSSNDVNTPEDRAAINSEINQIKAEMNRVFSDTEFNTRKIWDVDNATRVQVGTEEKNIAQYQANFNIPITDANKGYVPKTNVGISVTDTTPPSDLKAMNFSWTGADGKVYKSAPVTINPEGGTTAIADITDPSGNPVTIAGSNLSFSYNPDTYATYDQLVNSLATTKFSVYDTTTESMQVNTKTGIRDTSSVMIDDGLYSSISFSTNINYQSQYDAGQIFSSTTPDDDFIKTGGTEAVAGSSDTKNYTDFSGDHSKNSFSFKLGDGSTATTSISQIKYSSDYRDADGYWWGTYSDGGKYTADVSINDANDLDEIGKMLLGDGANKSLLSDTNGQGGSITVNYAIKNGGSTIGSMTMSIRVSSQAAQKAMTDASYKDTFLQKLEDTLSSIESADIISNNSVSNVAHTGVSSISSSNNRYDAPLYQATQSLMIQTGALGNQGIDIQYDSLRDYTLGISDIDVTTYAGAQKAIGDVANALEIVSAQRSTFGAYSNRLEHAYQVADNTSENTQAAESKLRDTDMDKEMVEMSKHNILQQSAQSMMMQANQIPQNVLDLLS